MEKIAFISGGTFIYWSSIVLTLAALTAVVVFAAVYLGKNGNTVGLSVMIPVSMVASIVASRFIHWYCRSDAYVSMEAALTDYSRGGYALMGTFIACIFVAVVLRIFRILKNLPLTFDAMAIGGGCGIAVGRLASLFNASDRGMILPDSVGFPFAYPVTNAVSGVVENRLATFMIQGGFTAAVVILLLAYMLVRKLAKKPIPDGDIGLMFMLAYGASQIICDSTRYDSLFLRSNGFVSVVQILSLVALVVPVVLFSIRMVKNMGFKWFQIVLWVLILGALGAAGYMEYYVQRHGNEAAFAYTVMGAGLGVAIVVALVIRGLGMRGAAKKAKAAAAAAE